MITDTIITESHRGLLFEDGAFVKVLGPGRYATHDGSPWRFWREGPRKSIEQVDVRQRELTIKGQEILTADKVAIRVSILVQFQVTDPKAALLNVESFEDRIYSDVQLAARRSLAGMTLEEIMTNRTRLSGEILNEVREPATSYGVTIHRADVKDLIFPGNLQEVMNRVLTAQRLSEAELVDARTKAEKERIESETRAATQRQHAQAEAEATRTRAEAQSAARKIEAQAEVEAAGVRAAAGEVYRSQPTLLRIEELTTLRDLAKNANARIYIGFDQHTAPADQAED